MCAGPRDLALNAFPDLRFIFGQKKKLKKKH